MRPARESHFKKPIDDPLQETAGGVVISGAKKESKVGLQSSSGVVLFFEGIKRRKPVQPVGSALASEKSTANATSTQQNTMSLIQFVQSRIASGAMHQVSLHRANSIARMFGSKDRLHLCAPRQVEGARKEPHMELPFGAPQGAKLAVREIPLRDAGAFVNMHHRHHASPVGHLFSIGCFVQDELVGVAIVGRPVARMRDDKKTVEITRLAGAGIRNVPSKLLGAVRREAKKRGYARVLTYTLAVETGASLRAAGYRCDGLAGGGTWSRKARQRSDRHPTERKTRWLSSIA